MQDLTPSEMEALSRAMGNSFAETGAARENRETASPRPAPRYPTASAPAISRAQLTQLSESAYPQPFNPEALQETKVKIEVVLGKTRISLRELLNLHQGSVIPLDALAGDLVDIEANGQLIARGEVVVVDDRFGVRLIELPSPSQ